MINHPHVYVLAILSGQACVLFGHTAVKNRVDGAFYEFGYTVGFLSSSEVFSCCGCQLCVGNDRLFKIVHK